MSPRATFLGAAGASAPAMSAHAQVTVQPAPQPPVIDPPAVEPPPAAQPVVIEPPPSNVIVLSPSLTTPASVPQAVATTTTPLAAPFNPAPPGTVIDTTAGRRVLQAVDGWDALFHENCTTRRAHSLLTEGIAHHNHVPPRAAHERVW